ncbi:MAG: Fe-S cluster assembly protein SufD [Ktedonobacterales bacterium]
MTASVARRGFSAEALDEMIARRNEPEWMREQRLAAWRTYQDIPMPTRQDEEWRRTDLRRLRLNEVAPYRDGADGAHDGAAPITHETSDSSAGTLLPHAERNEAYGGFLGLRDGEAVEYRLSDELKAQGVIFTDLRTALREHGELVRDYFMTRCVPASDSKFAALHAAFWENGTFLYVPRGVTVEQPLRTIVQAHLSGAASLTHTLIVMDVGSKAVYAEDFTSPDATKQGFTTRIVELILKRGAALHYVGVQRWGNGVFDYHTERALMDRDTSGTVQTIELGSQISKGRVEAKLEGDGVNIKLLGLYIGDGKQHLDRYTLQDHKGANGVSDLLFKGVLTDEARSVYSGLIKVHPGARGTAAYQQNRNLLLSHGARADSIPNLEIAANDIIGCSHGATVGKVDEEQLFYLMCRGLSRIEATHLIVEGFVDPIIEAAPIAALRDSLHEEVRRRVSVVKAD